MIPNIILIMINPNCENYQDSEHRFIYTSIVPREQITERKYANSKEFIDFLQSLPNFKNRVFGNDLEKEPFLITVFVNCIEPWDIDREMVYFVRIDESLDKTKGLIFRCEDSEYGFHFSECDYRQLTFEQVYPESYIGLKHSVSIKPLFDMDSSPTNSIKKK